jgi:hypothetical protein
VLATPIQRTDGRIRTCDLPGTPGRSTIEVTRIFTTGNMVVQTRAVTLEANFKPGNNRSERKGLLFLSLKLRLSRNRQDLHLHLQTGKVAQISTTVSNFCSNANCCKEKGSNLHAFSIPKLFAGTASPGM